MEARELGLSPDQPPVEQWPLSLRETRVLKELARGLGNKQIAIRLGISEKTVRNHLSRVFDKLHARNRTEAVVNAIRRGLQIV
jgi:DNA-binding NarL/FixJ family response regulator